MKRIISSIIVLCLVFAMTSCVDKTVYHWEFEQDHTSVKEIQIIYISKFSKTAEDEYTVVKEIDIKYASTLFEEIEVIDMTRYFGDPLSRSGLSILIVFDNGEYDIISVCEPCHAKYVSDESIERYISWLYFDEVEFEMLINKYLAVE